MRTKGKDRCKAKVIGVRSIQVAIDGSASVKASAQIHTNDARAHGLVMLEKRLTGEIIGAFYCVYNELGFGFLESVYRRALAHELSVRGLDVSCEVATAVSYKGVEVGHYRADLVVAQRVVVETKASETISEADRKQLLNYLRCTHQEVGLLLHFGPKAAFHRFVYSNCMKRQRSAPDGADPR